ncbi:MAG: sugar transferase [Chloroflexi bacterium]|nr:sugar transferase [Chloroflexota bacterium]
MIRRHITALRLTLMSADCATAVLVFAAISMVRLGPQWIAEWERIRIGALPAMVAWGITWVSILWLHGLYRLRRHWSAWADAGDILRATTLLALIVFGGLFVIQLRDVSRLFLAGLFIAELGVAIVSRLVIRWAFGAARRRGFARHYILIVGTSPDAAAFARQIADHPQLGLEVMGFIGTAPTMSEPLGRPRLGEVDDIERVLHERVVDEVAICLPVAEWDLVEAIARICAEEGRVVRLPGGDNAPRLAGALLEPFDGLTIQSIVYGPDRALSLLGKRLIDFIAALTALVLISPLLLTLAAAIRIVDGPPVLFRQRRIGLHGRAFEIVKFRTMIPDAEARLEELREHNEIQGFAFKLTADPRVTHLGAWLRRTSIDELPQLWNVIRGDMSLVGPRPPLPYEVAQYDLWHRRRLTMKPGITGLWQISARRAEEFDRWVSIDLDYIDRWSLWLDLKIIIQTIPAMLEGR